MVFTTARKRMGKWDLAAGDREERHEGDELLISAYRQGPFCLSTFRSPNIPSTLWNNDFPLRWTLTYRKEVLDYDNLEILWKYFPFSISPRISQNFRISAPLLYPVPRASVLFSSDWTELLQTLPRHQALSLAGVEGREGGRRMEEQRRTPHCPLHVCSVSLTAGFTV